LSSLIPRGEALLNPVSCILNPKGDNMTALAGFRTNLGSLIGSAVDAATWTNLLLDEALRNGLRTYTERGPVCEVSFVVTISGSQQDLGSLADLYTVVDLAWPWTTNAVFELRTVRWRMVDQKTVYLRNNLQPGAGDVIRVRYRKLYKIQELDGAASTTVPTDQERVVLLAAAIWLLRLRLRQISENPAVPKEAVGTLTALRDNWQSELDEHLVRLGGLVSNPVWRDIGL
jgi:hypothetical protein